MRPTNLYSHPILLGAFVAVIHLTFYCPGNCGADANDPFVDIDSYAESALSDWNTPGMAIAVVKDGEVIFARGYGVRKIGENRPVDTRTVFPIASITKTFNATGLAMLVDEGRLQWDDPVVGHLPGFRLHDPYLTSHISIADLLSHRTGLEDPDFLAYSGSVGRDELIGRTKFLKQIAPFRTGYNYNNLMIVVSGAILEQVSGQTWADFMRQRVFEPIEMNSTVADVLDLQDEDNMATVYVTVDGTLKEDRSWTLPLSPGWCRLREAIRPAGAVCSTIEDMTKFLTLHLSEGEFRGQRLLERDTALEMQTVHSAMALKTSPNDVLSYAKFLYGGGYGWQVRDYRGRKLVMHGGSTGTVLALMPEEKIGVVVLTNLGCGIQYMVMHDVFDRLLGIPRTWSNHDWIAEVIDKDVQKRKADNSRLDAERNQEVAPRFGLEKYAGIYESNLYGKILITKSLNGLSMQLGPNINAALVHWQGEQFRGTFVVRHPEDWFITFGPSDTDHVNRLKIEHAHSGQVISTFERSRTP